VGASNNTVNGRTYFFREYHRELQYFSLLQALWSGLGLWL